MQPEIWHMRTLKNLLLFPQKQRMRYILSAGRLYFLLFDSPDEIRTFQCGMLKKIPDYIISLSISAVTNNNQALPRPVPTTPNQDNQAVDANTIGTDDATVR